MPLWINATWTTDSLRKAEESVDFNFTLRAQPVNESVGAALSEVDENTRARPPRCDRVGYGEGASTGALLGVYPGRLPPRAHAQRGNAPLWISRDMSRFGEGVERHVASVPRATDGRVRKPRRNKRRRARTPSMRPPGLADDQVVRVVSAASTYFSAKSCGHRPVVIIGSCCG